MKRHPALQDLSRDHLFALRLAHNIHKAAEGFHGALSLQQAGCDLLRAWDLDLRWHFREEEEVLLPTLAPLGGLKSVEPVLPMLEDHAWLRWALLRLQADSVAGALDEQLVITTGRRLHDHVRLEERRLYPALEQLLSPEQLQAIQVRSAAFRRRWRSPDVIGPFRTHG